MTIDGRHLDIVCSQFSNRVLLIVSEHQKLGTVVSCAATAHSAHVSTSLVPQMEVVRDPVITAGPTHCSTYSVRTLLGKDNVSKATPTTSPGHTSFPPSSRRCMCLAVHLLPTCSLPQCPTSSCVSASLTTPLSSSPSSSHTYTTTHPPHSSLYQNSAMAI